MTPKKYLIVFLINIVMLIVFPISVGLVISYDEWSGESIRRSHCIGSTNQSPLANDQSVVQIFSARSARWRGVVSVHSWLVFKKKGGGEYTRYEVFGWKRQGSGSFIRQTLGKQDDFWYGYRPEKIFELSGDIADSVILKIESEISRYPFTDVYKAWPGPNSNTFIAHISRNIPEIVLDMPPTAIGKDYYEGFNILPPPSNSGFQIGYEGLFSLIFSSEEGIEINIGGAVYGVDSSPWALKLFSIGRIDLKKPQSKLFSLRQC